MFLTNEAFIIPYWLGSLDTNYIAFRDVEISKIVNQKVKFRKKSIC